MGDDHHIVVGDRDLARNELPLFLVCGTEHFHPDGNMTHFENGSDNLLALGSQIVER
jgi:hypothetical protein